MRADPSPLTLVVTYQTQNTKPIIHYEKKVFKFSTSNIHVKLGFIILEFLEKWGFEGMLKSIRKVGFEPHSTVLEKWGLSICSTVIEN